MRRMPFSYVIVAMLIVCFIRIEMLKLGLEFFSSLRLYLGIQRLLDVIPSAFLGIYIYQCIERRKVNK